MFKLYLAGIETWKAEELRESKIVQIVPCWNWNHASTMRVCIPSVVQIVPCWNWNNVQINLSRDSTKGSNCTLLELKLNHCGQRSGQTHGSNCTLLELKHDRRSNVTDSKRVQIVPCWNWNNQNNEKNHQRYRSNCTLLELKLQNVYDNVSTYSFKLYLTGIETTEKSR